MPTRTSKQARRAVRASNLNATIGKQSAPLIYPSTTAAHDSKQVAANAVTCSCGDCGFKFTSVAKVNGAVIAPICANCGSGKVQSKKIENAKIAETDASLSAVQCQKCSTMQIQSAATANAMATGYHCVTCGSEQILTPDAATGQDPDVDNIETLSVAEEVTPAYIGGENDVQPEATPAPEVINPAGGPVNAITPADSTTATVEPFANPSKPFADPVPATDKAPASPAPTATPVTQLEPNAAPAPQPAQTPVVPQEPTVAAAETEDDSDAFGVADSDDLSDIEDETADVEDTDEDFLADDANETVDDEDEDEEVEESEVGDSFGEPADQTFDKGVELEAEVDGDSVNFDMLPTEDRDDTELSFVYVGEKLNAFANGLHVATLKKELAGKNADLFGTDVLVRSVVAQCRETGLRSGLQSAGFKIVRISLPINALVAKRVKAAIAKAKAVETSKVQATAQDWKQSIAVALSGLNKNFFAGKENPLKAGLVTELSALGIRNPSKLVDKVFSAHGARFNKSVLEIATDVQSKSIEVRNQLAETLDSTNYVDEPTADETDEDDEEDEQMSVTARLNGSGHRIVAKRKTEVASSVGQSRISSILSTTGGSLFSR